MAIMALLVILMQTLQGLARDVFVGVLGRRGEELSLYCVKRLRRRMAQRGHKRRTREAGRVRK